MKMKNERSLLDIDMVLIEEYDLGFLLDQINGNKYSGAYFLSVIDGLRFITQFNSGVVKIRTVLKIDPKNIQNELDKIIGKTEFRKYLETSKQIARAIDFPMNNKVAEVAAQIEKWKLGRFPALSRMVKELRLKTLGKAPHAWQAAIEDYVLFDKNSPIPLVYRKQSPEINVRRDSKTREHYIEVRVYADTDIRYMPKINQWKRILRALPGYCDPSEWDQKLLISRFLQYVLRKHLLLSQKQTLKWLEENKLVPPDYQHASQELARFEGLFLSTKRK